MRRVDIEGDTQGKPGRKRDGVRPGSPTKSHLRRLALESLERRELLASSVSTLPSATLVAGTAGTPVSTSFPTLTALPNASSPTVVVDPADPNKLAASWQVFDTSNGGINGQITAYIQAAYSLDGGETWNELPGDTSADEQLDPSQSQANGPIFLTETTNASVAFGRDQQVYLLSSTHNTSGSVGVLDLQRVDLSNATAANPPTQTLTNKVVYAWQNTDPATFPTIASDTNLSSFSDVNAQGHTVTQTDAFANNLYVAWASTDNEPFDYPTTYNASTIKMVASSDEGNDFTNAAFVDDTSNPNVYPFETGLSHAGSAHYTQPQIAISQGTPTVAGGTPTVLGGQVSIVYDDYGTGRVTGVPVPYDQIVDQTNLDGGTSSTWSRNGGQIGLAITNSAEPDTTVTTSFPITVDITDPKFTTLQGLDATLKIDYPNIADLDAVLVPPTSSGLNPITLFANGFDDFGNATNEGQTGANLGEYVDQTTGQASPLSPGTTFDQFATRSIRDQTDTSPYYGTYEPLDENDLSAVDGKTAAQLNGVWTLQITAFRTDTITFPEGDSLDAFSLNFTAGDDPGTNGPASIVANNLTAAVSPTGANINPAIVPDPTTDTVNIDSTSVSDDAAQETTTNIQAPPILPSPSIAIDDTLGAYSQHSGRIYVTYTGRYDDYNPALPIDSTVVDLVASDDGGLTWFAIDPDPTGVAAVDPLATSTAIQVNDANGNTDGFSGSTPGDSERGTFNAQVAVDQYTGTVVVSFYDTRNDPSRDRVATYIAVSSDGGNTFAPETYANASTTAIDAITGNTVITGVIPDNESPQNPNRETVFSYGTHEGLAVADGRIIPVWSGNENLGSTIDKVPLSIFSSVLTTAGGPRIISSTMGPVGLPGDTVNTTTAADGSPVANSFEVTFDRPVDPKTFVGDGASDPIGTGDVRVFYQDPYAAVNLASAGPVTTGPSATTTSTLTASGHPGEPIVDANLTLTLSNYLNLSGLTVTLVAPNNQTWLVPITSSPLATSTSITNATFAFPANMVGGVLDGTYQLKIADSVGQTGLLKSWSLQLNGISTGLRVLSITPVPDLTNPLDNGTLGYTTFKVVFSPINPNNGVTTSVGTYSYVVRPNVSDRIRYSSVPVASAGVTNLVVTGPSDPAPVSNDSTEALTVSGHPNQFLVADVDGAGGIVGAYPTGDVAVTVSASILAGSLRGSTPDASRLRVFLATPDGQRYQLTGGTANGAGTILTFSNAQVLVPFSEVPLDGVYTLEVVGTQQLPMTVQILAWQVGLYSVLQTPNLAAPPVIANAQPSQVPMKLTGTTTTTSVIDLVGHPGKIIENGSLTLSLTDTNVNDLTITLIGPGGTTFVLPKAVGTQLNEDYTLPTGSPGFDGQVVDGQYELQISGANGDTGLLNSWSIDLTPLGPNGNAMDQNADGTPGQDPETTPYTGLTYGDDYSTPNPAPLVATTFSGASLPGGPYSASTLPLIVAGAHIITTNVTGTAGSTTGATTNDTVINDQVGSATVTFDRNVQIASVTSAQVLSIVGPAGPISSPQTFTSTGIAKTFASTNVGLAITKGVATPLTSTLSIFNTGLTVSSLTVTVNITDPNDQSLSLTLIAPDGTKVPLALNRGGNGANFTNTVFSDTPSANGLTIPIANGTAPFGLTYQPETPLSALSGKTLDGTWSLVITDNSATGSAIGRLNSWSLGVTPHVPQATGTSLTSSLAISNPDLSFQLGHLAVQLNITAPKNADVGATLVAPDGTKFVLFNPGSLTGANLTNTIFDNLATLLITQGSAPYSQTYRPLGYLNSDTNKAINGTWNLVLTDVTTDGQPVTLNSWSLIATPKITITPEQVYSSTDTSTTTYVSTDTSTQIYSSVDATYNAPLTIPVLTTPGSTITSHIVIPSTGGTFTLANLEVGLSITYPHDSNLSVTLTSPNGKSISLFAGVGHSGVDFGLDPNNIIEAGPDEGEPQVYDYTIFGDSGTEPIANGTAPFDSGSLPIDPDNTGTVANPHVIYRPAMPISTLLFNTNGTPIAIDGTWTLTITNGQANGPTGQFNGWALIATPNPVVATGGLPAASTQPEEPIPLQYTPAPGINPGTPAAPPLPAFPNGSLGQPSAQPLTSLITFASTNDTFILSSDPTKALSAVIKLTAPTGGNLADLTAVLVSSSLDPEGNPIEATLFNAGDGTVTGTGTQTLTLSPLDAISGLPSFANLPIDGTWKLEISDAVTADPADVLDSWSLKVTPRTQAYQQSGEPVPSTPASSLTSTITVPDNVPVSNLKVRLNLTAPVDSNLTAVLFGPGGQFITLFANIGGTGVDFTNTIFSDTGSEHIGAGTAPFSGTYQPKFGTNNTLAYLASLQTSAMGTWKLVITDTNPDGTQAVLNSWSLINTPPAGATLANTYQISFPTQQLSGTYSLTVGSGILGASPSVLNPSAPSGPTTASLGTPVNPNLNAGVDILTGKDTDGTPATAPVVYQATAVPVNFGKGTNSTRTLMSQLVVPDSFLIQGITPAGLAGLTVNLSIIYPNDPDLAAILIAPDGTTINLFTHIGNGSSRANFTNTTLSDAVDPPASIDNAAASFSGTFDPEQPLSDLAGHNAQGTWTLEITNANASVAFTGTLSSWSLTFQKPLPTSGLGDTVADRQTVNFQIFNLAPTNPLANDTWTAVGPAGVTTTNTTDSTGVKTTTPESGTFAGAVATLAEDPSDPTGNTVYVGAASGGIWKTNDFLTSNPAGPTYVPLTDFGPDFGLDIGSIAIFDRNNEPNQSILFAGTGFSQGIYPSTSEGLSYSSPYGPSTRGVGILKSLDGGMTWTLLDSSNNVDSNGNPLPESSPLRDHIFVGDYTYKVVVDPTPEANGNVIIYAAMGGPTGGLYRSLDSGNTWQLLSGGIEDPNTAQNAAATDIILDPNSKSPTTGNLDIVYAAFQGVGVFISNNQGQGLLEMTGQLGDNPLIQGDVHFPPVVTTVGNAAVTPNNQADGRIVLAKPALTGNAAEDLLYQDWLYAAVENLNGTFNALYVTKDRGQNWTKVQLLNVPSPNSSITIATPTDDNIIGNSYDPTANQPSTDFSQSGNSALTLTIDPTNPNIVYLGGTQNFQTVGLIRVDLTNLVDAHNFTSFNNQRNDGGQLTVNTIGAFNVGLPTTAFTTGAIYLDPKLPVASQLPVNYLNLRHAPNTPDVPGTSPFNLNATLSIAGAASDYTAGATDFTNDGTGVIWTSFDEPLKANPGDLIGSTNLHDSIAYIDPVTGQVRLVFADDQGVFTALVNSDGTLDNGIGTDVSANYSRNGNLQDEQFYDGAAQPSNVAAQAAGALFYASGTGILAAQSDPNILSDGNLTWNDTSVLDVAASTATTVGSPRATDNNSEITSADRSGVGIATDPTGGSTASGPTGSGPSVYEYDNPSLGGSLSDFFRVNGNGQTTGLNGQSNSFQVNYPFDNNQFNAVTGSATISAGSANNGAIVEGNFAVNPLNGSQILISSDVGTLFETTTKGVQWLQIGQATNFGQQANSSNAYASALAYGAPDPSSPGGIGNLNNFIYVGTVGGGIFVSTTDGQSQNNGQGWVNISSGLDGSSIKAIYPSPDRGSHEAYAVTLEGVFYTANSLATGGAVWTNISGNLTQIMRNSFGSAGLADTALATFGATNGTNPDGSSANLQYGGFDSIVADYRYAIPDLSGAVHPILYVSGYGGVFRTIDNGQTWTLFPNTSFDSAPVDGGYLPSVEVTNLQLNLGAINPATGRPQQVQGDPEVLLATTYGRGEFAIRLAPDVLPGTASLDPTLPAPGGSDSGTAHGNPGITNVTNPYIDGVSEISNYGNTVTITLIDEANGDILGTGTTDAFGRFSVQVTATKTTDPSFFVDGLKTIGIQATDSSGAKGNVTTFSYTLKSSLPAAPGTPVLESASDSGRFNNDDLTNILNPTFDITTLEPGTTQVELLRSATNLPGSFTVVNSAPAGTSPDRITDVTLASLATAGLLNSSFYYEAIQVDQAGNQSLPSGVLKVTVDNIPPAPPTSIKLDPSTNSSGGTTQPIITNAFNPIFDVTGLLPGDQLTLFRSINGSTPIPVGGAAVGVSQVEDLTGIHGADGTYTYTVVQTDIFGNNSPLNSSPTISIQDIQSLPPAPTLNIFPADDSGAPTNPGITNVNDPRFFGTVTGTNVSGLKLAIINVATGQVLATTTVTSGGTYQTQIVGPLADGTYTLEARTTNAAGNSNFSAPLVLTIKATPPKVVPTLSIASADDTGIKGDGVTAARRPHFIGTTDPGDTVTLYAVGAGGALTFEASTTSSTVNGSFSIQLPNALTDGTAQLVAQATDIAGNKGALSTALKLRIITVAGDYYDTGTAQLAIFNPTAEAYVVYNAGQAQIDTTSGRDIPVQYDFDGDGRIDTVGYRYNTAEYYGPQTTLGSLDQQYGAGGLSLPVSGYYTNAGTFVYGTYYPNSATWVLNTPNVGGTTNQFGIPYVDIPTPGAYNGGGVTDISVFRPVNDGATNGDTFYVQATSTTPYYSVGFQQFGNFKYQIGDIPAPADYDGVGRDEFAIYRPTTGQFFIINAVNPLVPSTWTLRTVTLNLTGGPNSSDQPAVEDYDGNGKADPTVYRPSNSTFYVLHTSTGIQSNIQVGTAGSAIAAAGPLMYRISALTGTFSTTDGFPSASVNTSYVPTAAGGGSVGAKSINTDLISSNLVVSAASTTTSTSQTSQAATIPASTATPGSFYSNASAKASILVGVKTPKVTIATVSTSKTKESIVHSRSKALTRAKVTTVHAKPKVEVKLEVVQPKHEAKSTSEDKHAVIAAALQHLGSIKKGHRHV